MEVGIHDRGRGPELIGTRITVDDVYVYSRGGETSRERILEILPISLEQLACVEEYIAAHPDEVERLHQEINERHARGNPPHIQAMLDESSRRFQLFRKWLELRKTATGSAATNGTTARAPRPGEMFARFKEWLAEFPSADAAEQALYASSPR